MTPLPPPPQYPRNKNIDLLRMNPTINVLQLYMDGYQRWIQTFHKKRRAGGMDLKTICFKKNSKGTISSEQYKTL